MANRPLDLPERELLPLLRKAIEAGVFTPEFLARFARNAVRRARAGRTRCQKVLKARSAPPT